MAISKQEMNKRYRESHRNELRVKARLYHQLHKNEPEYIKKRREYSKQADVIVRHRITENINHKKPERQKTKRYYFLKNKTKIQIYQKKWRQQNREKMREYRNVWKRRNPEKLLEIYKKYQSHYLRWALLAWSQIIKQRDKKTCQICGQKANIAHHIFFKSNCPQLQFNLNNGITLCEKHHKELHWGHKI